jgi:hypothetical protein
MAGEGDTGPDTVKRIKKEEGLTLKQSPDDLMSPLKPSLKDRKEW